MQKLVKTIFFLIGLFPSVLQAKEIYVGYLAYQRPLGIVQDMRPLLEGMSLSIGKDWGPLLFSSVVFGKRQELLENKKEHKLDMVRCAPLFCIELLAEDASRRVLAAEAPINGVNEAFYLVSLKESSVGGLPDLNGKKVVFGEQGSAWGDFVPKLLLMKNSIRKNNFEQLEFEPEEKKRLAQLKKGLFSATILGQEAYELNKDTVNVLLTWEVPSYMWVAYADMDKKVFDILKSRLPYVSSNSFKKANPDHRFETHNLPDLSLLTEAWHVAWLFDVAN